MTGRALVVQADALRLPLPDESVDLVVTSPPYFALRAYDAGPGQLGSELTPQAYLEALWQATSEMARVLRPSGSIFVNLGDKYATDNRGSGGDVKRGAAKFAPAGPRGVTLGHGIPEKSLMLLPERYRIGCVDHLGLIARAVIVWNKPNGLPESVTDRVRRSHEDWVHLTKQPRYYAAVDEVREPQAAENIAHAAKYAGRYGQWTEGQPHNNHRSGNLLANPLGKLPGSVWSIPSEPLRLPDHLGVDHYAAFPSEWPRRLILGFSPPGVCLWCGQGRWPVVDKRLDHVNNTTNGKSAVGEQLHPGVRTQRTAEVARTEATILGYACACTPHTNHPGTGGSSGVKYADSLTSGNGYPPNYGAGSGGHDNLAARPRTGPWCEYHLAGWQAPPTRPAVVVDVFGGTGTTAMVARALGRIGISIDLSFAYCRAARWRIRHDAGKAISRTNLERQGSLL